MHTFFVFLGHRKSKVHITLLFLCPKKTKKCMLQIFDYLNIDGKCCCCFTDHFESNFKQSESRFQSRESGCCLVLHLGMYFRFGSFIGED